MKLIPVSFFAMISLATLAMPLHALVQFPGEQPGQAKITSSSGQFLLGNNILQAEFSYSGGKLQFKGLKAGKTPIAAPGGELFIIKLKDGTTLSASQMTLVGRPVLTDIKANPKALNLAGQEPGKALAATFTSPDKNIRVIWRAILRNGSHYLRQEMVISSAKDTEMEEIVGMQYNILPDAESGEGISISGNTRGPLLVGPKIFAALETPMALNTIEPAVNAPDDVKDKAQMAQGKWIRQATLHKGSVWEVSSVIGLLAPEQERRSFLAYLEREKAVSYRPFIHYNSWYELNINSNDNPDPLKRMTEQQCIDVVNAWNEKLYKKRGVNIDAFVWDDGWDDFNSLWGFHKGFPNGFKKLNAMAVSQKAGVGAWLGPVGGYGASKQLRLDHWNKTHPSNKINNFQLADPEYYNAFLGRCSQMVHDYDMRYFKFDGISTMAHATGPNTSRLEDAEGILTLVKDLRKQRGDLFINCTVGTWASPFWFRFADSIWRQKGDWGNTGKGDSREKWITYRDATVHEVFVEGAPFCPINSMMTHGLMITKNGAPGSMPKDIEGIKREMRCAFACGSAIQELYIDHDLMNSLGENEILWDELVKCIKWFRSNADVLDDTHWVGGNPWNEQTKQAEIYGWASWSPQKAVFALRNPDDKEQTIKTTLRKILDLPPHVKTQFQIKNAYDDQRELSGFTNKTIDPDKEIELKLNPFEVFVFNLKPTH